MNGSDHRPSPAHFSADPEVGADLATVDWEATPLGPPDAWPQSLRTAVSILLSSRFSMWMAWGPRLTFFCNDAYRRNTLGRKYPWALGRPASEVWAEIWDDIGPRIDTVLRTGEATWDEALLLFLERSGYPEESYHTFSYSPLRDDDGALVGMLCVVSEDTDRVIGERRMATLRDLGSDPSVVRTQQEMLAFASRQLGRNLRDLPFTLTYLFPRDGEDDGAVRLASATGIDTAHPAAAAGVWPTERLAGGEPVLMDLGGPSFAGLPGGDWPDPPTQALLVPLLRQGGTPYGFLVAGLNRYRPLDDGYRGFVELAAGHVAAGVASARSYQAQQRRAEELAELDRAKTAFFSNISHEFRTPLTLIMGPVEELRARLAGAGDQVREDLEVIHRNGLRLGKLVNTLLDFSRIEAGRMQARYEPVDLAAVTAELASVFRSAIERAGLGFAVDCPPLPEPVHLDRGMWEKVVLNLLSNALKFTFDGRVEVAVRAEAGAAVVTVADTGIGVAEQEMPRLFERFHRIENARSRSNEGSGIGLALVRELVGLHGGTITADSTVGRGTAFTVRLPFGHAHLPAYALVTPDDPTTVTSGADPFLQEALRWLPGDDRPGPPAPEAVAGAGRAAGDGAAILVADDNADMRDYLARLLDSAGHRVTVVADGQAALDAARADVPDLVVSDVMMPRLDGLRLVAALRGDPRTASVPVVLLSARAGPEASVEGLDAGADDYLFKPFSAAELLARVRANVELARQRHRHARAMAALGMRLAQAENVDGALAAVLDEVRRTWRARYVLAAVFGDSAVPAVTVTDPGVTWESLPEQRRRSITALRDRPVLTPVTEPSAGTGIALEHPHGTMTLWIEPRGERPFTGPDEMLLALLAGHLSQGLRRIEQIDQQRETALALQRAILGPDRLPSGFVVGYEPATRPLKVGGDWYDTIELGDGRIGIVVGDCVGHGLRAATVMGQLRSACRALLLRDADPARTLMALDRFAALLPGADCATVFCGVLDPGTGHLVYSSAGHPPAIVGHPDGTTHLLDQGRSRPVAVRAGEVRPGAEYTMPARATLLLYTDGLVERRREPLTTGIGQAGAAVRHGLGTPIEDLATEIMTRLSPASGYDDDVALLLYRHPGPLELEFPAEPDRLAPVRSALRGWLDRCGIDPRTIQNVLVAVGEACANAIEHGHREQPGGRIRLRAAATAGDLRLTIADSGRWKPPDPAANPYRGRGLKLMRAFMHTVTVTSGTTGTVVDMQARLFR